LSYQWLRNRNASNQAGLVPTEAERAGDLSRTVNSSGDPVRFADPATGAAMSGGVIPAQAATITGGYGEQASSSPSIAIPSILQAILQSPNI